MTDKIPTVVVTTGDSDSKPSLSSTSVVDRMMSIPHIVTAIIQYASRDHPTLARLMRLDKCFYKEVAPLLYHTVAFSEQTANSFFLGSYKPCRCDECLNELKEKWGWDSANKTFTEWGEMFNKPHRYGKYNNPAPRPKAPTTATNNTPSGSSSSLKATKDDKEAKANDDGNNNVNKDTEKDLDDTQIENSKDKSESVSDEEEPEITLPISKKELLGMVRVLTLGSHHESACEVFSTQVEKFMQGVEILRIVETPCAPHRTWYLCENCPGGSCPIVEALNPRKIVVRNVSGLQIPFPALWKANTKTKEMVFVLPSKMMAYTGADVSSLLSVKLTRRVAARQRSSSRPSWASSPKSM